MNIPPKEPKKKEDLEEILVVAETIVSHTKLIEFKLVARIQKLEIYIKKLEKEIENLKNKPHVHTMLL